MLVDFCIVTRPGISFLRKRDLAWFSRQMRLHMHAGVLAAERSRHFQLLRRRGDGEARRDGVALATLAVPFLDQRLVSS